jgi:hypothetical protein
MSECDREALINRKPKSNRGCGVTEKYKVLLDKIFTNAAWEIFLRLILFSGSTGIRKGRAVAQWLRHYATNRQVAGSIPDGFIGILQ